MRPPELNMKRARGFLLIVAVLVLVVVAIAIVALGNMTSADIRASAAHAQSEQSYFAAESGLQYATYQFGAGTSCAGLSFNKVTVATDTSGNPLSTFTTTGAAYVTDAAALAAGSVAATTDNPLSATATSINVNVNPIGTYAPMGRIQIDAEQINYTGLTASSFTGVIRGVGGSTAATHAQGTLVAQSQCLVTASGNAFGATRVVRAAVAMSTIREGAMAVYGKGTALTGAGSDNRVYYRTWDVAANTWSAESATGQLVSAGRTPIYFVLQFARTRNEAILGVVDSNSQLFIFVWNGVSWSNPRGAGTALAALPSNTYRGFQIAYEYQNDRAIIVYATGTRNPKYAIWDGTTLDIAPPSGAGFIHTSLGLPNYPTTGTTRWVRLASSRRNGSNDILMITLDSARRVYGARWTGTAWSTMGTTAAWDTTATDGNTREAIDVAYEAVSNRALFIWGANANWAIRTRTWTPTTSTLSGVNTVNIPVGSVLDPNGLGPAAGAIYEWIRLYQRPDTNEIMAVFQDARAAPNTQLTSLRWDGSAGGGAGAWDANATLQDVGVENLVDRSFDFGWETFPPALGNAWLVWGSGTASNADVMSTQFTSPATWGGQNGQGLDDVLLTQVGVLPLTGTFLAGLYGSINAAAANRDIKGIYAPAGGAAGWITPGAPQFWAGSTANIQRGERVHIGVQPTTALILFQAELYP